MPGHRSARDHVVATLAAHERSRPRWRRSPVNGVMAGCTPTMMPILIAIAQGMGDHEAVKLEGWTCSNAGWLPTIVISGPIRDGHRHQRRPRTFLSAYTRAPGLHRPGHGLPDHEHLRRAHAAGGYERPGQRLPLRPVRGGGRGGRCHRPGPPCPPTWAWPTGRTPSPCSGPASTTSCPPSPSAPRWSGCAPCGTAALTWAP